MTLHIEDIGTGGEGIGKADGFTFFVKDAIVGDVIEAKVMKLKKNYGYARLMKPYLQKLSWLADDKETVYDSIRNVPIQRWLNKQCQL